MDLVQPTLSGRRNLNTSDGSGVRGSAHCPNYERHPDAASHLQAVNTDGWHSHDAHNILANPY